MTDESISASLNIQDKGIKKSIQINIPNNGKVKIGNIKTEYPYSSISMFDKEENLYIKGPVSVLASYLSKDYFGMIDFNILYIGQAYGSNGERTAIDRLKNHSTLQGILAESMIRNPDREIWILLCSFKPMLLSSFDGRSKKYEKSIQEDDEHIYEVLNKPVSEHQMINFTEAALIKYFQPKYNKLLKDTFPNPAHSSYGECYDIDLNMLSVEIQTEQIKCKIGSDVVKPTWIHIIQYQLNSKEIRKEMFEI